MMRSSNWILSLTLFLAYFCFLIWGASQLPVRGGPDELHSMTTVEFYQTHGRLARMPEDVGLTKLSPYGSSRLTRPPFAYALAAVFNEIIEVEGHPFLGARIANAFCLALCIVVLFQIALAAGAKPAIAAIATFIASSIPQFLFYGIYVNDDAAAFLASALLALATIHLVKQPRLSAKMLVLMAALCGFVFINKITAWLMLPAVGLTVIAYLMMAERYKYLPGFSFWLVALVAFVACGGFWLLYNVTTYGISDPFQSGVDQAIMNEYGTIGAPGNRGYLAQFGRGYLDVLFDWEFLRASYMALVGNLGWLELQLDLVAYTWFGLISIFALATYLISSINVVESSSYQQLRFGLMMALFTAVWFIVQFAMYVYFNVYGDIQIQGKYLLPALPLLVFYLSAGLNAAASLIMVSPPYWLTSLVIANSAIFCYSLFMRVIPHYNPPRYDFYLHNSAPLQFFDHDIVEVTANMEYQETNFGAHFEATQPDPLIILSPAMCDYVGSNFLLQMDFTANQADNVVVYIDEGRGFQDKRSYRYPYKEGSNNGYIIAAVEDCHYLRIDPMSRIGTKLSNVHFKLTPFHAQKYLTD